MKAIQKGFSLVELMIAILLASITAIVVLNVLTSYQNRTNTLTGRNDAEVNSAMGLFALEKEIRMSGAGLSTPGGTFCSSGVNVSWAGAAVLDGAPLLPLRIIDGGAGPDQIEVVRSDSAFGAAPTRLVSTMATSIAQISVDSNAGLQRGDLMMLGSPDGSKLCTLVQLTSAPAANGSGWLLTHGGGIGNYNPTDPSTTYANDIAYEVRDAIVNMGRYGVRRHGIVCSDGGTPAATNNCDLVWWNPLTGVDPTLATATGIAPDIVDLQAQYGVSATAADATVTAWVDATGGTWAAPSLTDARRIKAMRVSIISRGRREGVAVGPSSLVMWDEGQASELAHAFSADEQKFRYQVLTVVVPLINAIWAGT
jgi:type IV pilus assembly protein PilW